MAQRSPIASARSVRCRDVTVQIQTVVIDGLECLCLEDVQRRFPSVTALCINGVQFAFLRDANGRLLLPLRIEVPADDIVDGLEPIERSSQAVDTMLERLDARVHQMDKKTDLILSNTQLTLFRLKHIMTLMYELHEYTTPRYFFILPVHDHKWASINSLQQFFLLHYKLYFLCECSNEPDKLHIAPHDGYSIKKPSEFIAQYGSYLRTTLCIARGLLSVGGFVLPRSGNVSGMLADALPPYIQESNHYTEANTKLDAVEKMLQQSSKELTGVDAAMMRHVALPEAPLQGAQLRELEAFLDVVDNKQSLGNLYRTVTDDGHVRWVCLEHYNAISFGNKMADYIRQLEAVGGKVSRSSREVVLTGQLTSTTITMLCTILKNGFTTFTLVLEDCFVDRKDLDSLFDVVINRSSIHRLLMCNVQAHHRMRTSKFTCSQLSVDLRNQSLKVQIASKTAHETMGSVVRLLKQNKICRTFHFSGYDLPLYDTTLVDTLRNYRELTALVINHFLNVDFLHAIVTSSTALRRLKLSYWFNGSSTLYGLCQAIQRNQSLVDLDIMDHTCADDKTGTVELLKILYTHPSIKRVRLHVFDVQPANDNESCLVESLREYAFITHLRLSQSTVSHELSEALVFAASEQHSLTYLEIYGSHVNEEQTLQLQSLLTNEYLTHLTISADDYWSVASASHRQELQTELRQYQNAKLERLMALSSDQSIICLDGLELTDNDMHFLAKEAIIQKQCTLLSLQSNKITSIGVSLLVDALENTTRLEMLYLSNNYIADDGAACLAHALSNGHSSLKTLILSNNRITDRGAKALAQMLTTNRTITWLYLGENAITDTGVRSLAEAIKDQNRTLAMLVLSSNRLVTDASVDHLLSMVEGNPSLKKLWIDECNLSETGRQRLRATRDCYIQF